MGPGGSDEVRRHRWFDSLDWDALHARRLRPPRQPKDDSAKRLKDLVVRAGWGRACGSQPGSAACAGEGGGSLWYMPARRRPAWQHVWGKVQQRGMVADLASNGVRTAYCSANSARVSLAAVKQAVLVALLFHDDTVLHTLL